MLRCKIVFNLFFQILLREMAWMQLANEQPIRLRPTGGTHNDT